mgnify:CR=1 FL=1
MSVGFPSAPAARLLAVVLLAGVTSGCADEAGEPAYGEEPDPMVVQALNDQLMVDPDLVGQNEANTALTGSSDASIPLEIATPEAIREARQRAEELLAGAGGTPVMPEPEMLERVGEVSPLETLGRQVALLPDGAQCLATANYSAIWAARLPQDLPVYPRGATMEALGSDEGACRLRAVRFHSPVPAEELVSFYFGLAESAGYSVRYLAADGQFRLEGEKGDRRFAVQLRPSLEGLSEVDLVVAGS